jgi:hypothetical protein
MHVGCVLQKTDKSPQSPGPPDKGFKQYEFAVSFTA